MKRFRLLLVLGIALLAALVVLAYQVRGSEVVIAQHGQQSPTASPDLQHELVAARRDAVQRHQGSKIVLPANPPPRGIPAWATQLPTQPRQGMPVPRGAIGAERSIRTE